MTALILGMVSCPQVLAAQNDGTLSSRVRKADAADVNVDNSRVRSVQSGNSGDAYSSRVRKARTEEAPAVAEEARVKPVTGNLPDRVSDRRKAVLHRGIRFPTVRLLYSRLRILRVRRCFQRPRKKSRR